MLLLIFAIFVAYGIVSLFCGSSSSSSGDDSRWKSNTSSNNELPYDF